MWGRGGEGASIGRVWLLGRCLTRWPKIQLQVTCEHHTRISSDGAFYDQTQSHLNVNTTPESHQTVLSMTKPNLIWMWMSLLNTIRRCFLWPNQISFKCEHHSWISSDGAFYDETQSHLNVNATPECHQTVLSMTKPNLIWMWRPHPKI